MKTQRRQYYRQLQSSFTQEQYDAWNKALTAPLLEAAKKLPKGTVVAVYQAKSKEANLAPLFQLPLKFCFPRVLEGPGAMEFRHVDRPEAKSLVKGAFGLLEHTKTHPIVDKKDIQACFVPLLAFDAQGRRLGKGGGYYDRFLEGFKGQKIGVGFEWQFSPSPIPVEEFDQRLHMAVTEHGVRTF